ncbi:MAG TPA: hypothetical protein VGB07_19325 [Blastocatellia bacterium]
MKRGIRYENAKAIAATINKTIAARAGCRKANFIEIGRNQSLGGRRRNRRSHWKSEAKFSSPAATGQNWLSQFAASQWRIVQSATDLTMMKSQPIEKTPYIHFQTETELSAGQVTTSFITHIFFT